MTTTSNKHIDVIEVTFSASHGKGVTVDDCISQSSIAISQIMATTWENKHVFHLFVHVSHWDETTRNPSFQKPLIGFIVISCMHHSIFLINYSKSSYRSWLIRLYLLAIIRSAMHRLPLQSYIWIFSLFYSSYNFLHSSLFFHIHFPFNLLLSLFFFP